MGNKLGIKYPCALTKHFIKQIERDLTERNIDIEFKDRGRD